MRTKRKRRNEGKYWKSHLCISFLHGISFLHDCLRSNVTGSSSYLLRFRDVTLHGLALSSTSGYKNYCRFLLINITLEAYHMEALLSFFQRQPEARTLVKTSTILDPSNRETEITEATIALSNSFFLLFLNIQVWRKCPRLKEQASWQVMRSMWLTHF